MTPSLLPPECRKHLYRKVRQKNPKTILHRKKMPFNTHILQSSNLFGVPVVKSAAYKGCMHPELGFWTPVPKYRLS